jgi:hypothetical protein
MRTLEGAGQRGTPSTIARSVARRQGGDERETERARESGGGDSLTLLSRATCALPLSDAIH